MLSIMQSMMVQRTDAFNPCPISDAFVQGHFEKVCDALRAMEHAQLFQDVHYPVLFFWSEVRSEDVSRIQDFIQKVASTAEGQAHAVLPLLVDLYQGFLSYVQRQGSEAFLAAVARCQKAKDPWVCLSRAMYLYRYHLNEMQFVEALDHLSDFYKQAEKLQLTYLVLESYLDLARLHFLRMDLNLALHYLKQVITHIKQYPEMKHSRLLIPCSGLLMQIHYIVNEQDELYALLEDWHPLRRETLDSAYSNLTLMIESLTYLHAFEQVDRLLSAFKGYAEQKQQKAMTQYIFAYLEPFVALHRAIQNADQGMLMQLDAYWEQFTVEHAVPHRYSFYLIQRFLLAFYLEDYTRAQDFLFQHQQRFNLCSQDSFFWVLQNYMAVTQEALQETEAAVVCLVSILRRVSQTGYIRLFADHYHGSLELLTEAVRTCQATAEPLSYDFLRSLSQALGQPGALIHYDFSDREQEVLYYLAQDMTQQSIAETLSISKNTVKFHIKNIYKKIGAENKRDARAVIRQYYS